MRFIDKERASKGVMSFYNSFGINKQKPKQTET